MPDPRPLTVAELSIMLGDFEGDEPVYFGDRWPVCSAERIYDSTGAVVVLSASPPHEGEPEPAAWWRRILRAITESVRGLADARVSRGPLGSNQGANLDLVQVTKEADVGRGDGPKIYGMTPEPGARIDVSPGSLETIFHFTFACEDCGAVLIVDGAKPGRQSIVALSGVRCMFCGASWSFEVERADGATGDRGPVRTTERSIDQMAGSFERVSTRFPDGIVSAGVVMTEDDRKEP